MANFKCLISGTLEASALPWSFGFYASGAVSEASAASTVNAAATTLFSTGVHPLKSIMATDVSLTAVTVSTLDATYHQTTKTAISNVIAGTDVAVSLPKRLTIMVTTRSDLFTKSGHGRMALPPFATDTVAAGGVLSSTVQGNIVSQFDQFFSDLSTGGLTLFIFNRKVTKGGTPAFTQKTLITFDVANEFRQHAKRISKVVPTRVTGTI